MDAEIGQAGFQTAGEVVKLGLRDFRLTVRYKTQKFQSGQCGIGYGQGYMRFAW